MHNVQDYNILYNNAVLQIVYGGSNFMQCGKHLHERIISLQEEIWAHKTSLTPSLCFIEVPVSSQIMYLCVVGINFASFYNYAIVFWNCSDSVVHFVFSFYYNR
jgi:hypothetical protein